MLFAHTSGCIINGLGAMAVHKVFTLYIPIDNGMYDVYYDIFNDNVVHVLNINTCKQTVHVGMYILGAVVLLTTPTTNEATHYISSRRCTATTRLSLHGLKIILDKCIM